VPTSVIKAKCAPYRVRGKPARRTQIINRDDYHIVATYGAEYRGIVQYYLLAGDVYRLHRLRWAMQTSLLATLASKHRSTVTKIAAKHQAKITTPLGLRTCYEAIAQRAGKTPLVARFGGIPLTRHKTAVITDRIPTGSPHPRKELINRLLHGRCELCQQPRTGASPPRPQAGRPQPQRASPTPMGQAHGTPTPKNPRGLRRLPRLHPHGKTHRTPHGINH
jgi:hypothetical protein